AVNPITYAALMAPEGLVFPYFLLIKKWSLEKSALVALVTSVFSLILMITLYAFLIRSMGPLAFVSEQVGQFVDQLVKAEGMKVAEWQLAPEEYKAQIVRTLPSIFLIASLVLLWANFAIMIRVNPHHF